MPAQKMYRAEPYAVIEGSGTNQWRVQIWTERFQWIPTQERYFWRKAAAERWASKELARQKRRMEHERERTVVTL